MGAPARGGGHRLFAGGRSCLLLFVTYDPGLLRCNVIIVLPQAPQRRGDYTSSCLKYPPRGSSQSPRAGSQRQEAPRFFPSSPPRGPSRSSTNCRCTMQNPRKCCTMQLAERTLLNLPNSYEFFFHADPLCTSSPSHASDNEESTPSRARLGS